MTKMKGNRTTQIIKMCESKVNYTYNHILNLISNHTHTHLSLELKFSQPYCFLFKKKKTHIVVLYSSKFITNTLNCLKTMLI